jgi:Putative zinc-finger
MSHQDRDQSVEQWLRKTPGPAAPGDLCLDADTLAAWAEGALAGAERASAEAHASTCARCQAMLAVMVRTMPVQETRTGSPIRKWLMMLSPAMAAAAAIALWFAVDQRQPPVPSAVDSVSKSQARNESVAASPSSTVATESDRKPPIVSPDRDAQEADRSAEAEPADARRSREVRGPSAAAVPATTAPANERKDLGTPKRSETTAGVDRLRAAAPVASVPPPPPGMPAPAPPPPGPAPQQQANQAQNQTQNQAVIQAQSPAVQTQQTQSQGQTPRQQAPAAVAERVVIADKPVGRAAAESSATGGAAGRGGTTGALADAAKLAYRRRAGGFELEVAASSVRWRVADGRTVQRSLDAGANFSTQYTAESGVLLTAGAAPSANVCWLVGRAGAVVLSTDGRVWRRLTFPEQVDLTAVTATDGRTATVTTADGRRFGTADGGGTWVMQ